MCVCVLLPRKGVSSTTFELGQPALLWWTGQQQPTTSLVVANPQLSKRVGAVLEKQNGEKKKILFKAAAAAASKIGSNGFSSFLSDKTKTKEERNVSSTCQRPIKWGRDKTWNKYAGSNNNKNLHQRHLLSSIVLIESKCHFLKNKIKKRKKDG